MTESPTTNRTPVTKPNAKEDAATGLNWTDPNIPAGNAPPMPVWPLVISVVAFSAWMVFLVAMAVLRVQTTAH